ncbi:MAG: CPBP family intramembrane metalloprotease [Planctomycetaceae bacterium]|nr:CPBP family intramembrane metalloprotease [Planctomycetaceae bacterium]
MIGTVILKTFSDCSPLLILGQVVDPEVTPTLIATGALMLLAAAGSAAMIVVWFIRWQRFGFLLPAARRPMLRSPVSLLAFTLILGFLLAIVVAFPPSPPVAAAANSNTAENSADTDKNPSDSEEAQLTVDQVEGAGDDTGQGAAPNLNAHNVMANMQAMLLFDLVLGLVLAGSLFVASQRGRVWLPEKNVQGSIDSAHLPRPISVDAWGDLDAPVPVESTSGAWRPTAASMVATSVDEPSSVPGPDPDTETINGASLEGDPGDLATLATSEPVEEEHFSLLTELRYAAEVFLAAFLPTTILRILIVAIVVSVTGEQPDSHPFLEMMDDGIAVPVLAMIAIMAVVVAPLLEEMMYRVIILGGFAQLGYAGGGLFVSSLVFCFAHNFPDSIALLPLAFALGYTYLRRKNYITVILVHFLFNTFNMVIAGLALPNLP